MIANTHVVFANCLRHNLALGIPCHLLFFQRPEIVLLSVGEDVCLPPDQPFNRGDLLGRQLGPNLFFTRSNEL